MKAGTVRLMAFAEITGATRDSIRNIQKTGDTPWDDSDFPEEGQRRYTGYHALARVMADLLHAQGFAMSLAAEVVRAHTSCLRQFLDAISNGQTSPDLAVAGMIMTEFDEWAGYSSMPFLNAGGSPSDIEDNFRRQLALLGTTTTHRGRKVTVVYGPQSAVVPVAMAYRILRDRARTAGYIVDGYEIFAVESEK